MAVDCPGPGTYSAISWRKSRYSPFALNGSQTSMHNNCTNHRNSLRVPSACVIQGVSPWRARNPFSGGLRAFAQVRLDSREETRSASVAIFTVPGNELA
jgi:hypothetical protein